MDPYSVLGVAPSARPDEVKAAYRARSRLLHPDIHRDASGHSPQAAHEAFAQLCEAYQLALRNLDTARDRVRLTVDSRPTARETPVRAAPVAAGGQGSLVAGRWLDLVVLAGVLVLGWLLVTDWLPAFLQYSAQ